MLLLGVLHLIVGTACIPPSGDLVAPYSIQDDRTTLSTPPDTDIVRRGAAAPDSQRARPKPVEIGDWYYRRLTIHRVAAYSSLPVFGLQWAAGDQLYHKGAAAPTWAKTMHRVGATSLVGIFAVNSVTGAWNLWDSRSVEKGRVLRTVHGLTMLGLDGVFSWAGATLAKQAENSESKRREHHIVALSAIGVSVISSAAMKLWNR